MSIQQLERPPPYSNDFGEIQLPSVPKDDDAHAVQLAPARLTDTSGSLPLTNANADSHVTRLSHAHDATSWPSSGINVQRDMLLHATLLPDVPKTSPGGNSGDHPMTSKSLPQRRDTTLSAEDLIVAEALTDLRQFGSPPPLSSPAARNKLITTPSRQTSGSKEPEPLLSLLKNTHPWLGGTIDGSLSAYASTKSHSPRFVQYGANFVERNIGTTVASTVESVGRKTGVEGRLRNYLDSRRPSDLERMDPDALENAKRRKVAGSDEAMDIDEDTNQDRRRVVSGRSSIDSLPAYDEARSPPYEQDTTFALNERGLSSHPRTINRSWSTQLMISTSGLGVALSEGSLRSLQYCLGILRNANNHVRSLMLALKKVLEEYQQSSSSTHDRRQNEDPEKGSSDHDKMDVDSEQATAPGALAERIKSLNEEIWKTLKTVVEAVSRYTGGALPDNASAIVRLQLLSVPQRWRRAVTESVPINDSQPASDTISNAHRMLAFAREGLDMMANVGGVVESTIISAERWLDSMGRRKDGQTSNLVLDSKDGHDTQPAQIPPIKEG